MLKIMRHHPQTFADLPHVPLLLAKQTDTSPIVRDRMNFTGQQLQQGRFPRPVRAQDSSVYPFLERERQVCEHAGIAPVHSSMLDVEDWLGHTRANMGAFLMSA